MEKLQCEMCLVEVQVIPEVDVVICESCLRSDEEIIRDYMEGEME